MTWNYDVCKLTLPDGQEIHLHQQGKAIYISEEDADILVKMRKNQLRTNFRANLAAFVARLRDAAKIREHARDGHVEFDPACPACRGAHGRMRPHRRFDAETRLGGQLSVDISGPHLPGKWPSGRGQDSPKNKQCTSCSEPIRWRLPSKEKRASIESSSHSTGLA